jgi:hypothetical protein
MENINNLKLNRKSPMILPLGAAVVVILLLGLVNGRIMMDNLAAKKAVNYLDQEIGKLKKFLDNYNLKKDRLIPIPMNQVSQLIDEITRLGGESNIDFIAIQSQEPRGRKKDLYQRMPLAISVRSDFREVANFLRALREVETTTIIITEFKLTHDEESPPLVRGDSSGEVLIKDAQ